MVETRDVTWETTLDVGAVLSQLSEVPEQEGTHGLENAPELGGTEDFVSAQRLHCRCWGGEFLTNSVRCPQ